MARRALVLAGWVCSTLGLAIVACGEGDEGPSRGDDPHGGGQAAEGGETTTSGTGGAVAGAGDGGGGVAATGGSRGGSPGRGGSAGSSGSTGATGGSSRGGAGSGTGGEGGGVGADGGAAGGGRPEPVVCDRLAGMEIPISERVALSYDVARHRDCRLAWFETLFLPPIDERLEYVRAIARQSRILWGCIDGPLSGFSLVHGPVPLSQAEVDALIGVYLDASRIEAQLSPSEVAPIERALEALAAPLVESTLEDFSRSRCPDGGVGGRGGAGGAF